MAELKAVIKNADMSQELQEDAIDVASRVGHANKMFFNTCVPHFVPPSRIQGHAKIELIFKISSSDAGSGEVHH